MSGDSDRDPAGGSADTGPPDDWRAGDEEIERRLRDDEHRMIRDEIRLARDEERIEEDERWIRRNWRLALALSGLLALTVAALVISVLALNRNIDAVATAVPKDDSVGTSALQDGAVTASRLADAAVTRGKIAPAAVGGPVIADRAVTARMVAADGLTGAQIDESSLAVVPLADRAGAAGRADDASRLAGNAAGRYLRDVALVRAETQTSTLDVKGPVSADCPSGTTVIAGGASIDGAARVAITTSAPDGGGAWVAEAAALGTPSGPWRIVVTAVCARGGR